MSSSNNKRKRHTPEQVIAKLREAEAMLAAGKTIAQVCQALAVMEDVWRGVKSDPTVRSAIRHLKHELQVAGMDDLAAAITGRDHHYALRMSPPS